MRNNPLRVVWDLVFQLVEYTNILWQWLSSPLKITIFGYDLISIVPIYVIGGVGLTAVIILWIIRG